MKINNKIPFVNAFALSLLASFPWFLSAIGGYASNIKNEFIVSFLFISLAILTMTFLAAKSVNRIDFNGDSYGKVTFYAIIIINLFVLCGKIDLAYKYDFQLGTIRHYYFNDVGKSVVFFGSSLYEAFYNKVIIPATMILFILPTKNKKEYLIAFFIFLMSSILVGGRFFIYEFAVITLCKALISGRVISYKLIFSFLLIILSFFVIANRLGLDIFDGFLYIFRQVLNYHVIQLPILSDYQSFQKVLAPFVGIETLVYFLFGYTPPETILAEQVQFIEKYAYNGDGPFNAFATSLAYFFPVYGVEFGSLIFIFSIASFLMFLLFVFRNNRAEVVILFIFVLFFSAFSPFVFSFQFFLYIIFFALGLTRIKK
ncbi:O-antigen polymerase [Aeromonas veronii]|uniref:O-antigen polymerase n=1 Tax=Aeromonas veronii TaxID=654 RepID=UPI0018F16FB5|nr:O-antigen polymerase [Aeromonas veronii]MBJ7591784.1 oligosaccharide repeat unit polymerase [Aeromonas veronii]